MRRGPEFESQFYTGRMAEADLLGEVRISMPEYIAAFRKRSAEGGYVKYADAIELAKRFQPADPTNPDKDFARELRMAIADRLIADGVITEAERDRVKYFTAVKTPLDILHGVDAFVELDRPNGRPERVTLDLSLRDEKVVGKADLVVRAQDIPDDPENESYLPSIGTYAERIARRLEEEAGRTKPGRASGLTGGPRRDTRYGQRKEGALKKTGKTPPRCLGCGKSGGDDQTFVCKGCASAKDPLLVCRGCGARHRLEPGDEVLIMLQKEYHPLQIGPGFVIRASACVLCARDDEFEAVFHLFRARPELVN